MKEGHGGNENTEGKYVADRGILDLRQQDTASRRRANGCGIAAASGQTDHECRKYGHTQQTLQFWQPCPSLIPCLAGNRAAFAADKSLPRTRATVPSSKPFPSDDNNV